MLTAVCGDAAGRAFLRREPDPFLGAGLLARPEASPLARAQLNVTGFTRDTPDARRATSVTRVESFKQDSTSESQTKSPWFSRITTRGSRPC